MKKHALSVISCLLALVLLAPPVAADLSPEQQKIFKDGIPYFNVCGGDGSNSSSGSGTASGTPSGGVAFDDSQSSDTGGQTTIDDDGIDPSPTGSPDHQGSTSYADGQLGALHTNYFALNPGWSAAHGIVLGDVGALTYKGKTVYAVYGDNHVGDTPHAEISVKAAMGLTGITNPAQAENSLSGVHFVIYPGTHSQLNGSVDQSKIDQIGAQVSGAGTAGGSSSSSQSSSACCSSSAADTSSAPSGSSSGGSGKYGVLVSSGASFAGVDQGIDFVPSGGSGFDILAPGSGKITLADQTGHSFNRTNGTAEIIEQLDQKPNAPNSTGFVYFAEIITINSKITVGASVQKGDVIGHNDQSPGIEVGWARDGTHGFAAPLGSTSYGDSFNQWIQQGGGSNSAATNTAGSGSGQCCPSGSSTSLSGSDNETKIWNYFKTKGLSDIQDAAIIGNIQQESSFNPTEVESGGNTNDPSSVSSGWGLVQWTPGSKVLGEAQTNHISGPIYQLATQLDLIWAEMTVTHFGGFDFNAFKSMSDLATATNYFVSNFEHAGVVGPRTQYATVALKKYGGTGGGATSTTGSSSGDCSSSSTSGYQNPLRDVKGLFPRRIDQGVDYGGNGPVYAVGNGTVDLSCTGSSCGWPTPGGGGGGWVSYTLSDGPAKGNHIYFAESCTPAVKTGDKVTGTTKICDMNGMSYPWIETGWASGTGEQPLAQLYGGNGCCSTTAGVNFDAFLQSLPNPPPKGQLTNPPIGQPLPSSYPSKW